MTSIKRTFVAFSVELELNECKGDKADMLGVHENDKRPTSPSVSTISSRADSAIGRSSPSCGLSTPSPPSMRLGSNPLWSQQVNPADQVIRLAYCLCRSDRNVDSDIHHVELKGSDSNQVFTELNRVGSHIL